MRKISAIDKLIPAPKNGDDGKPAVSYYLTSTRTVITVDPGPKINASVITVRGWRVVGDENPVEVNYPYTMAAICEDSTHTDKGTLPVRISTYDLLQDIDHGLSDLHFDMLLPASSDVVATLDIAFVYNGKDGKDGADGTSFIVRGNAVEHVEELDEMDRTLVGYHLVDHGSAGTPVVGVVLKDKTVAFGTPKLGDAYVLNGYIYVMQPSQWENLGAFRGPQGATGPQGPQGATGPQGPMAYLAGEWQKDITYTRDNVSMPIVRHNEVYWFLKKETSVLGSEPSAKSPYWELLMENDIVFAKIVMSEFGKLASAVFSGAYMLSQYGKLNGQTVDGNSSVKDTAYTNFEASNPEGGAFVPNLFINFLTGYLCAMNAKIKGEVNADKGSIAGWEFLPGRIGKEDRGMSLSLDTLQFNGENVRTLLGLWNNLGYPILQVLEDTRVSNVGKCGIDFNMTGSVGHPSFAFKGNGSGTLNGLLAGYSFESIILSSNSWYQMGGNMGPMKSNKVYVRALVRTPFLVLPSQLVMMNTLAIADTTPFSMRLTVIADIGSTNFRLYGRNKVQHKDGNTPYDNDIFPVLTDFNANDYEYKEMAAGDCVEVELFFNPDLTATVGGYPTKYTARILNINT